MLLPMDSTFGSGHWLRANSQELVVFSRNHRHEFAHRAAVFEFDDAGDLGKEGVVFAAADVQAGFDAGAALTHDDGAAGNELSAESLYTKPLRVGVAAVSRTT